MDGIPPAISPSDLYPRLGTAASPIVLDVRPNDEFDADDRQIVGAVRCDLDDKVQWLSNLPANKTVIAYCTHGREASQAVAAVFRKAGVSAAYLDGGMAGWRNRGLPTRRKSGTPPGRWVTREHPKIDRIACPWLVLRFINPDAEFIYVPAGDVLKVSGARGAIPYDIKDVEFGHVGDRCSFDAIMNYFSIEDPALYQLATIVRGADTSRPDLAPQCQGLLAISHGLSANFPADHEMLRHGLVMYDALYAWCRMQQGTMPDQSSKATT